VIMQHCLRPQQGNVGQEPSLAFLIKKKPRRSGVSLLGLWPDNPGRVHSYRVHPAEPEDPVEPQTRTFVPKYLALVCGLVRFQSLVSFRSSPRPKSDFVTILRLFSPSRWLFPSSKRLWRLPQPWLLNRYFTTPCYVASLRCDHPGSRFGIVPFALPPLGVRFLERDRIRWEVRPSHDLAVSRQPPHARESPLSRQRLRRP